MMKRGIVSVDYDDKNQSSYKSFDLKIGKKTVKFNTGDPVVDWVDYRRYIDKHHLFIIRSSSTDHFYMDGNDYYELYYDPKQECTVTSETLLRKGMDYFDEIVGFVAKRGMNSLKDIMKHYKKVKGG